MRTLRSRGAILVTAVFVTIVLHALVTVMLASLRTDTGMLRYSDERAEASVRAHSAALYAIDTLEGNNGATWEANHTVPASSTPGTNPPPNSATLSSFPADGHPAPRAWIQMTNDPELRKVWGASFDGKSWQYSTAVVVRRPLNPGLLFAARSGALADEVYFRPTGSASNWTPAPPVGPANTVVYGTAADGEGKLFVLSAQRATPLTGSNIQLMMLDTSVGASGSWSALPSPVPGFRADATGLAVGSNNLYLAGRNIANNSNEIWSLPLPPAAGTWQPFTTLPTGSAVSIGGQRQILAAPFSVSGLQADGKGALLAHLIFRRASGTPSSSFARYENGQWVYLPEPSVLSGTRLLSYLPPNFDDLGNVVTFGLPSDASPGRIFRFAPTGQVVNQVMQGSWKPLPTISPHTGLSPTDLRDLTIDTNGNMYLGMKDSSISGLGFENLMEYPLRSNQNEVAKSLVAPTNKLHMLEAGGQGDTSQLEFIPVSWY